MAKGSKMALVARRYLGAIEARKAGLKARERISVDELTERYRHDFDGFCALLDIIPKDGVRRKLTPLKSTQRIYNAARTARDVVLKPRQVAITTIEVARDIWFWLTRPGSKVVVVCQSSTDHGPLNDVSSKIRLMLESLERANVALHWRTFSSHEWSLEGRDGVLRIVEAGASEAAAQKKGRGGTVHRLHVTEVAFFEYADQTLNALLESVPDRKHGSEVVFESTANGAAGWFFEQYDAAKHGRSGYRAHFLRWLDFDEYATDLEPGETITPANDRERIWLETGIRPEQIKWYRKKLAERGRQDLVDQEYPSDEESCWLIAGNSFFDAASLASLIAKATRPAERLPVRAEGAYGELRIWHPPERKRDYIISVDTSEGTGGDAAAAHVYERGTGKHMATLDGQFKPWELARAVAGVGSRYNTALIAVERNNHGHAVLRCLNAEQHYHRIFIDRDGAPGWKNHEVTRAPALDTLEQAIRGGHWVSPDLAILGELRTFVVNVKGKAEAAKGAHDDHVITAAIGWDVLCRPIQQRSLDDLPYA